MSDGSRRPGSLEAAGLYLVSPSRLEAGDLTALVPELAAAGVDLIQLREKEMEAADLLAVAEPILAACRAADIPFIVNDRPDVAATIGADGVHVGQNDLPVGAARAIVGHAIVGQAIVGLSSHAPPEIDAAVEARGPAAPDYLVVGPVYDTPTKAGRPSTGLQLLSYARDKVAVPWFAIGGIDASNLAEVMAAGATRIVVVRAITEAPDPPAAAAGLKAILEAH